MSISHSDGGPADSATAEPVAADRPGIATDLGPLAAAGFASLGAGAIHAAAIGVHSEHRQAVIAFAVVALAQLGWGAAALVRGSRRFAAVGVAINVAAIGGWALAKTAGISFVDGLDQSERLQLADGLAVSLAAVSVILAVASVRRPGHSRAVAAVGRSVLAGMGALALIASMTGMVAAGSHAHSGGIDHGAGQDDSAAGGHGGARQNDSAAGDQPGAGHDDSAASGHDGGAADDAGTQAHTPAAVVPPKKYDPTLPIDLSGVDGVTPQQQAAAENLIAITLVRLPRFADYRVAERAGFHSIGDGGTGHEHFVKWDYINDDQILNPDKPESLVYATDGKGGRKLVSAMFIMKQGASLDSVPNIGGELTQWHIHDNLCFTDDPVAPRVAGVIEVGGTCAPPLVKFDPTPMIHVWITKHPCGPFSALEGVGAGQVKEGETHKCDIAHGG